MAKFAKQVTAAVDGKAVSSDPVDPAFQKSFPALFEYLTLRTWGQGKSRETATLTVFCEADMWKVSVNDRANQRTCFVSAETFQGVLQATEQGLAEDSHSWRKYDATKGKFRK